MLGVLPPHGQGHDPIVVEERPEADTYLSDNPPATENLQADSGVDHSPLQGRVEMGADHPVGVLAEHGDRHVERDPHREGTLDGAPERRRR